LIKKKRPVVNRQAVWNIL